MPALHSRLALVVGGAGSLGRAFVNALNNAGFGTLSLDLLPNALAHTSITITQALPSDHPGDAWKQQLRQSREELGMFLGDRKLHSVVCAAGGWVGGSIGNTNCIDSIDYMYMMNLQPAINASHLAVQFLGQNGLVVLTGAAAALKPCPGMIGYGLSKAATHHLAQSLAVDENLPTGSTVICVLPDVIDTPTNREAMPGADYTTWTKPSKIAEKCVHWAVDSSSRPTNGTLLMVSTKGQRIVWTPTP